MEKQEFYDHQKPRKLMDQVSDVMRLKHYAFRTEQTYICMFLWGRPQRPYKKWSFGQFADIGISAKYL